MMEKKLRKGAGLMWIETIDVTPNGNLNQEGDSRISSDCNKVISPVSFKHKIRELLEVPTELSNVKRMSRQEFIDRYLDARVFGSTFFENDPTFIMEMPVSVQGKQKRSFPWRCILQFMPK